MIRQCLVIPAAMLAMLITARFFYHSMKTSTKVLLKSNGPRGNLNEPQNCDEKEYDAREMRLRIDLVKKYTKERSFFREAVVIFGTPDGSSEVFGSIISSDAKVFYLPKVLNKLSYYMKHEPTIGFPLATALIEEVLKCNFEEKEFLLHHLMQDKTRNLSRTLLGAPECVAKERYGATLTANNRCTKAFSDWLATECDQSDQLLIQTDQLKSILSLQVLMTVPKLRSLSIRVVHVVRDPRAVIHDISKSVTKELSGEELGLTSYRICAQMMLNVKTGENPPNWLEGRYLLVKIEDFLNNPKRELAKLNEFLKRRNNSFGNLESLFRVQKAQKWRSEMSPESVRLVEEKCGKVLALLRYKKVA
ncbi:carbohydrate sulfotransferase 3-like [Actinia tenebrosa]|uniref:Carbohydrate sulfotransferase 3-like n=1 Tax=Actinia tenebrosa TaxID=6105 RepID=A0A6P8I8J3_ACTTE|nr:carbohydrate sulfotransferase 3-like [Actinia tenebrosa]